MTGYIRTGQGAMATAYPPFKYNLI